MTRTRLCFLILILTPLLVYWQTIFSEYGFKEDYASVREAREEPGQLVRYTASHGRPLYGALLESSLSRIDEIKYLWVPRFASVILLTVLGIALWRQLYHSGWTETEAAVIGLGAVLLPGAQVITSWAIAWPHAMALLLALAGFSAIETELERGGLKRAIALVGGALIYGLAAVIYQSNALFAVVPLAAVLLVRATRGSAVDLHWLLIHLSALFVGLFGSYLFVKGLFANGVFQASARMQIESNPFTKLGWFFSAPLPNALALYVLKDDFNTGVIIYWAAVVVVVGVIYWGCRAEVERGAAQAKRRIIICAFCLPFLAHLVSIAAAERAVGYRTTLALSGLVLVLLIFALRSLRIAEKIRPFTYHAGLIGIAAIAVISAHSNSYSLIALPQNYEWETMRSAVMRAEFPKTSKVYIVTPASGDRVTTRVFSDEFGSVSSASDVVAKEMFNAALHERYPVKMPKGINCKFTLGREEPDVRDYDLVIDMRKFRDRSER